MDNTIWYLNTDLDLVSRSDLTALAAAFKAKGVFALYVTHAPDGQWYARFETDKQHTEPEPNIAKLVAVVESLGKANRATWLSCVKRDFNIGYDCGDEPWEFNQGLPAKLLGRLAAIGGSLRITLYPDREPNVAKARQQKKATKAKKRRKK